MEKERVYYTLQSHSGEDGWSDWSGEFATFHAASESLAQFRKMNQAQPVRILRHHHTAKVDTVDYSDDR